MKKKHFIIISTMKLCKSNSIYLVNRFVSSPFFEPTYQNTLNVFDYEKKIKTTYFDVFPSSLSKYD